jgi:hypothetical protein
MSTDVSTLKVRIPKAEKTAAMIEIIREDEDFRFDYIQVDHDDRLFKLPIPNTDDTEEVKVFYGVILHFRPIPAKDDRKEKRELTLLRCGKIMPEQLYLSNAGLWLWKGFMKQLTDQHITHVARVLVKFKAVEGKSGDGKHTFTKVELSIVRELEDRELDYVMNIVPIVAARIKKYTGSSAEELEAAENALMDPEYQRATAAKKDEADERQEKAAKSTRARIEDDEDDDEPPAKKPKKKPAEDDDDEDEPKPKSKKKPVEDDDDDDEPPAKKPKKKAADDDDDDDEDEPKPKSKKKPVEDDDDDDDEPVTRKPKKNGKKAEEPVSKGKGKYPDIDDDDDEDLKPKPKKKAAVEDDDED